MSTSRRLLHTALIVSTVALLSSAALAQKGGQPRIKPRWGIKATTFMKGRIQVLNSKPIINVRSFGQHYKEQEQWAKATEKTVEVRFDPHLNVGHTSVRVGKTEYQMLGSRAASGNAFSTSEILDTSVGAVFRVRSKDVKKIDARFQQAVTSANKHNFPAFSLNGRTLTVKRKGNGWEIQNTKRRAQTRIIEAKLVSEGGKDYLVSPNGYRQPVLGRSGDTLQVASKSCTTFVVDTMNSAGAKSMPKLGSTPSARGLARTLMSTSGGLKVDGVVHYSVDANKPKDLASAVETVLNAKSAH